MPTATVECNAPSGMTLSLKLGPYGTDSLSYTISLTERTTKKGVYSGTQASPAAGWYDAWLLSGAVVVGSGRVYLTDTATIHRVNADDQSKLIEEHDATQATLAALNNLSAATVWAYANRSLTTNAPFSTTNPVASDTLTLYRNCDYDSVTAGRPTWTRTVTTGQWAAATGTFSYKQRGGSVVNAGTVSLSETAGILTATLTLTDTETAAMTASMPGSYEIVATSGTSTAMIGSGPLVVEDRVA